MLSIIISIIIYSLINSVLTATYNQTKTITDLSIDLEYGDNDTIILLYNITTNNSYFITFRAFGDEQLNYGLYSATSKLEEKSIQIFYEYQTKELFYLFIICFHFIVRLDDLDIQCKDIRLLKRNQTKSGIAEDFLPTYSPLFVPMMYALSVLMLLPVIIQHHRHKRAQVLQRRKQLRRLSITIAQDDQNPQQNLAKKMLTQITENGNIDYEHIPTDMELLQIPSRRTNVNDTENNTNVTFVLQNLQPFTHEYDDKDIDEPYDVNADDCIAHLLDNAPWNTSNTDQPLAASSSRYAVDRDSVTAIKEPYAPTIISFHDDDDDDDRKPILKSSKHSAINLHRTNRVFFESDV